MSINIVTPVIILASKSHELYKYDMNRLSCLNVQAYSVVPSVKVILLYFWHQALVMLGANGRPAQHPLRFARHRSPEPYSLGFRV